MLIGKKTRLVDCEGYAEILGDIRALQEHNRGVGREMEAKFVTYRTLIDSQADKVKLALDASNTAVDKSEKSFDERLKSATKALDDFIVHWRAERERGQREIAARAQELEGRIRERAALSERALDKAEGVVNERLKGMNEFRKAMEDDRAKLVTRELVEALVAAMEKRVRTVEDWSNNIQGRLLVFGGVWGFVVMLLAVMANYAIRKAFE